MTIRIFFQYAGKLVLRKVSNASGQVNGIQVDKFYIYDRNKTYFYGFALH